LHERVDESLLDEYIDSEILVPDLFSICND